MLLLTLYTILTPQRGLPERLHKHVCLEVFVSDTNVLLRLQEVDLELMRLRKQLSELPQRAKIEMIRAATKKLIAQLNRCVGERKDLEMELEENEADHKNVEALVDETQAQLHEAGSDYRALRDFETQLSQLAKRIEKLEFDHKKLAAKLDEVRGSEKKLRTTGAQLQAELKAQSDAFHTASADIEAQLEKLQAERDRIKPTLAPELQLRYETARERFDGLAVETLQGNKPSICRVTLQPSSYHDIMYAHKTVQQCPYCHRILIVNPE